MRREEASFANKPIVFFYNFLKIPQSAHAHDTFINLNIHR